MQQTSPALHKELTTLQDERMDHNISSEQQKTLEVENAALEGHAGDGAGQLSLFHGDDVNILWTDDHIHAFIFSKAAVQTGELPAIHFDHIIPQRLEIRAPQRNRLSGRSEEFRP